MLKLKPQRRNRAPPQEPQNSKKDLEKQGQPPSGKRLTFAGHSFNPEANVVRQTKSENTIDLHDTNTTTKISETKTSHFETSTEIGYFGTKTDFGKCPELDKDTIKYLQKQDKVYNYLSSHANQGKPIQINDIKPGKWKKILQKYKNCFSYTKTTITSKLTNDVAETSIDIFLHVGDKKKKFVPTDNVSSQTTGKVRSQTHLTHLLSKLETETSEFKFRLDTDECRGEWTQLQTLQNLNKNIKMHKHHIDDAKIKRAIRFIEGKIQQPPRFVGQNPASFFLYRHSSDAPWQLWYTDGYCLKQFLMDDQKQVVIQIFNQDPKTTGGASRLYDNISSMFLGITNQDITKYLARSTLHQLLKPVQKYAVNRPIVVKKPAVYAQVDLVDMRKYASKNNQYNWILTYVDCFSKFAVAVPMKSKQVFSSLDARDKKKKEKQLVDEENYERDDTLTMKKVQVRVIQVRSVVTAMQTALTRATKALGRPPDVIQSDNGSEFKAAFQGAIRSWYRKHHPKYFPQFIKSLPYNPSSQGGVERFNRTLKTKIFKMFVKYDNKKWIDFLDSFMENYNASRHNTINERPNDVGTISKHMYTTTKGAYTAEDKKRIAAIYDRLQSRAQKMLNINLKRGTLVVIRNQNIFAVSRTIWKHGFPKYEVYNNNNKKLLLDDLNVKVIEWNSDHTEPTVVQQVFRVYNVHKGLKKSNKDPNTYVYQVRVHGKTVNFQEHELQKLDLEVGDHVRILLTAYRKEVRKDSRWRKRISQNWTKEVFEIKKIHPPRNQFSKEAYEIHQIRVTDDKAVLEAKRYYRFQLQKIPKFIINDVSSKHNPLRRPVKSNQYAKQKIETEPEPDQKINAKRNNRYHIDKKYRDSITLKETDCIRTKRIPGIVYPDPLDSKNKHVVYDEYWTEFKIEGKTMNETTVLPYVVMDQNISMELAEWQKQMLNRRLDGCQTPYVVMDKNKVKDLAEWEKKKLQRQKATEYKKQIRGYKEQLQKLKKYVPRTLSEKIHHFVTTGTQQKPYLSIEDANKAKENIDTGVYVWQPDPQFEQKKIVKQWTSKGTFHNPYLRKPSSKTPKKKQYYVWHKKGNIVIKYSSTGTQIRKTTADKRLSQLQRQQHK